MWTCADRLRFSCHAGLRFRASEVAQDQYQRANFSIPSIGSLTLKYRPKNNARGRAQANLLITPIMNGLVKSRCMLIDYTLTRVIYVCFFFIFTIEEEFSINVEVAVCVLLEILYGCGRRENLLTVEILRLRFLGSRKTTELHTYSRRSFSQK